MELLTRTAEFDLVIKFWLSMDKMCQPQNKTLLPYNYKCVCVCVCIICMRIIMCVYLCVYVYFEISVNN